MMNHNDRVFQLLSKSGGLNEQELNDWQLLLRAMEHEEEMDEDGWQLLVARLEEDPSFARSITDEVSAFAAGMALADSHLLDPASDEFRSGILRVIVGMKRLKELFSQA